MSKYDNAIKLLDERIGGEKELLIVLSTISLSTTPDGKPRPATRMVCAYYDDGALYVSTDARKNKTLQIAKNKEVAVCGLDGNAFQGQAENLGWVKETKNADIRTNFKKIFAWFDDEGDEDNPNSIILKITLTEGVIFDRDRIFNEDRYEIDFITKIAR